MRFEQTRGAKNTTITGGERAGGGDPASALVHNPARSNGKRSLSTVHSVGKWHGLGLRLQISELHRHRFR